MNLTEQICAQLEDIATLLELRGENPFKVRAYHQAVRSLETLGSKLGAHLDNGTLEEVPGIGKSLAQTITLLYHGKPVPLYEELKKITPPGLLEMLRIAGFGPKKIIAVHTALGIDTLAQLKTACENGKIAALPGFGEKSAANILKGIEQRIAYGARHLAWEVFPIAQMILEGLQRVVPKNLCSIAGSMRRHLETIGDLDFVVGADDAAPVMAWFTQQSWSKEVLSQGPTKCSVRLESGMQVDLRVVPVHQYPFAVHHFTGSKEHNIQMRHRALERGYSLSEWGLRRADREGEYSDHGIKSEEDLFAFFGLDFIAPEMREGYDEIEKAQKHKLPVLIELSDIRGAFHNHTTASDGHNTLEEMAQAAQNMGWEYLGISDHSRSSIQANGLSIERLRAQIKEIHALNASKRFKIHLFTGTECDILPTGELDFPDEVLAELDYVVASVHSSFTQDEATMTARLIRAIEHPLMTMLGHPTGRLLLKRPGYAVDLDKVIDAAIVNKKIIELNASPQRLDLDWRYWRRAADRGLMCSINPDAHATTGGRGLSNIVGGVWIARKGGLSKEQVLGTRSLKEVKAYLDSVVTR